MVGLMFGLQKRNVQIPYLTLKNRYRYGCQTCECRACPVSRCKMFCENGFKKDSAGCDTCECVADEKPRKN